MKISVGRIVYVNTTAGEVPAIVTAVHEDNRISVTGFAQLHELYLKPAYSEQPGTVTNDYIDPTWRWPPREPPQGEDIHHDQRAPADNSPQDGGLMSAGPAEDAAREAPTD